MFIHRENAVKAHQHNYIILFYTCHFKGECSVFLKKNYIMYENDSLSKYIKILLGHNRTNGAVYSKINFKVQS